MKEELNLSGITVTSEFKQNYKTKWRVYPTDNKAIFAKAFKEIYFVHGLQQLGYYWEDKSIANEISDEELANKVFGEFKKLAHSVDELRGC